MISRQIHVITLMLVLVNLTGEEQALLCLLLLTQLEMEGDRRSITQRRLTKVRIASLVPIQVCFNLSPKVYHFVDRRRQSIDDTDMTDLTIHTSRFPNQSVWHSLRPRLSKEE